MSGVAYIAEPGGSIRDDNVIEAANKHCTAMAFTYLTPVSCPHTAGSRSRHIAKNKGGPHSLWAASYCSGYITGLYPLSCIVLT